MRHFHFTGRIQPYPINVILKTDAISNDTDNMTVMEIQIGLVFGHPTANEKAGFEKNMAPFLGAGTNPIVTKGQMIKFAQDKGLDLISTNSNGTDRHVLVDDSSVSNSQSQF